MKSEITSALSNVNSGHKRLWVLVSIAWLLFSIYVFGVSAYMNQDKGKYSLCYGHKTSNYTSISSMPFELLYECKIGKLGNFSIYVVSGPRYITFGRLMLIITPPFFIPLFYLAYIWVRNGFNEEDK